ncbi:MAG: Crp/Fnr family transcriptional regulator [Acidobacteriota bacterium]
MSRVYSPRTAVALMVTTMEDGSTVEVVTVGNEGLVGFPVFLGTDSMPMEVFTQIDGEAVTLPAPVVKEASSNGGALRPLLARDTQALLSQIAQAGACNRLHPIDQRCARWLLMSHDRVPGDDFSLTQEFLSQMLGVRRATVTTAASILQRAGYIRYRRGRIQIADREGLEAASCECYRTIRSEYERLIGSKGEGGSCGFDSGTSRNSDAVPVFTVSSRGKIIRSGAKDPLPLFHVRGSFVAPLQG